MATQQYKAEQFRKLHVSGDPVVLYNVWDPGSAKAAAQAGATAIATSSWAVAEANGFSDGEHTPLDVAIENLRRIVASTELPVTVDLESGYGVAPQNVGETIARAIDAGAIGCNLEDSFPPDGTLREIADQVARIQSGRKAADTAHLAFFINARTDVFINTPSDQHNIAMVSEALKRAEAYKQAGADGLFVPGLADLTLIAKLTSASPLPVNVLVRGASTSISSLAKSGVARVSYGGTPYANLIGAFKDAVRQATGRRSE
jgi:2-methylisocitrate lyase-like PEP mutase family enzyme